MKQEAAALCLLFNVSTAKNGTMIDLARKTVQQSIHIEQTKTKLSQQNITKLLVKMSRPFQTITETCLLPVSACRRALSCKLRFFAKGPDEPKDQTVAFPPQSSTSDLAVFLVDNSKAEQQRRETHLQANVNVCRTTNLKRRSYQIPHCRC